MKIVLQVNIRYACGTWKGFCAVTSIHSIQESTRNSQKLGHKLVHSVSESVQLVSQCWQEIQSWKQREFELISKKVWKEVDCCSIWSNITTVVEEYLSSENVYIYLAKFSWSMIWWWSSYVLSDLLSTNKLVSTNQWANKSYSRGSFARSI